MATLPFETFIFGNGQATVVVFYDDVALKLVRVDYTVLSGSLVATVTNTKSGSSRNVTATQSGSLALPGGNQFPISRETNDVGEVEIRHGNLTVQVGWHK